MPNKYKVDKFYYDSFRERLVKIISIDSTRKYDAIKAATLEGAVSDYSIEGNREPGRGQPILHVLGEQPDVSQDLSIVGERALVQDRWTKELVHFSIKDIWKVKLPDRKHSSFDIIIELNDGKSFYSFNNVGQELVSHLMRGDEVDECLM